MNNESNKSKYLMWDQKTLSDFSEKNVSAMYDLGYVFTRLGKGVMQQTRSVRIDLAKFSPSSENRRILKKVSDLQITAQELPITEYDFKLGKLAKDFYDRKFQPGIMSAQKIKEMLTDSEKSNFNLLLGYSGFGYAICYKNSEILHYSYPFYDLEKAPKDMGLGMMAMALNYAKEKGCRYAYLGSLQRPGDTYKLQFDGLEWFDGKSWQIETDTVKKLLLSGTM